MRPRPQALTPSPMKVARRLPSIACVEEDADRTIDILLARRNRSPPAINFLIKFEYELQWRHVK
jgi:hypothetical protein